MTNLDNIDDLKKLDSAGALDSIAQLADQAEQGWSEARKISFDDSYRQAKAIVCAGMGGSAYGMRIVKSLYDTAESTRIPMELVNNYTLPGYVDEHTIVILSSYSGTTEETLASAKIAKEKKAKIIGITSGGPLADFLKENDYPAYIFTPTHNPSKQPRIGQGYMQIGIMGMLSSLGYITLSDTEVEETIAMLRKNVLTMTADSVESANPAKQLARSLVGIIPVFIATEHLEGAIHAVRNPFHETAKQFALYFPVPELNHHLMEGLQFPKEVKPYLRFVFIESTLYSEKNGKRMKLTREVVEKNDIKTQSVPLSATSAFGQVMEYIQLGSFVTFYLAMLNDVDPNKIQWVDYFKNQLKS